MTRPRFEIHKHILVAIIIILLYFYYRVEKIQ